LKKLPGEKHVLMLIYIKGFVVPPAYLFNSGLFPIMRILLWCV